MSGKLIGFLVNPIAGMGGKVGLKGTDGVLDRALEKGAEPVAPERGTLALENFKEIMEKRVENDNPIQPDWLTCGGKMGESCFKEAGYGNGTYRVVLTPSTEDGRTTSEDTRKACKLFIERGVALIVFVGGDGTARDVLSVVEEEVPILGIPSGVKMHSGVFCVNPEAGARILERYLDGQLETSKVEIMDLDEERYRQGEWNIKLYGYARTPYEANYIQGGKLVIKEHEEDIIEDIAWYIQTMMSEDPEKLWILGAGGTLQGIGEEIGIDKSLLGIDAVVNKELVAKDVSEKDLMELLEEYGKATIVVSPIGAQGFIFGRGNLQISGRVIRKVGIENIQVVSTPAKLNRTPVLRVDTDDPEINREFEEKQHMLVITGDHFKRLHPLGGS